MQGLSLVVASGGQSSSWCAGLSLLWPLLLRSTSSRCTGSVVVAHGPSCSAAYGIFPDQGSNPYPLHWQADSQPLHHQGSPPAPLIEETVFSPLYILASFVIDYCTIGMWVYLWAFYPVPWIYIFVLVPVPYCLDYCSFVVFSEVREPDSSSSIFFPSRLLWLFRVLCVSIQILRFFVLVVKNATGNLIGIALNL